MLGIQKKIFSLVVKDRKIFKTTGEVRVAEENVFQKKENISRRGTSSEKDL